MTRHAVGVMNGNFRNGDYYRYVAELGKSPQRLCTDCGKSTNGLPLYLVGKTDLCYSCYEADKEAKQVYGETWERDADQLHELLNVHPADLASALDLDPQAEARETERNLRVFGPVKMVEHPTYDQLIAGAKFTNQHRADLHKWWNEEHSDEAVRARIKARGGE